MKKWTTKLIHSDAEVAEGFESLVTPVFRGSTTLFSSAAGVDEDWHEGRYTYGLYGTPTTRELAARIAELEKGEHTFLTPGGQSAIALIDFALLSAGDHVLIPDSVYGPNRQLADDLLKRFGVSVEYYPSLEGAQIQTRMRPNTRLVWCESPGSVTMEVQDVPAIAQVAHSHGAIVAIDNTYSAGVYFDAFAHGADVTMQALTKYIGGHSDLLLGSVTVRSNELYEALGLARDRLGMAVSPDDCSLALRGMQTLGVRLAAQERSALQIAKWLASQQAIATVLHPALPSCGGHDTWKRDFTGSTSVFSIVFRERTTRESMIGFIDSLALFKIGYSWGGVTSLVVPFFDLPRTYDSYGDRVVRINIGLEDTDDLVADLGQALAHAGLAAA
jgi:cysteine-S-conjugate beta-lyase